MSEFETAYAKYRQAMYHTVRRMGLSHAKAEDSVQAAAARLGQMDTISYIEPFRVKGLFCATARSEALNMINKESRQERDEREVMLLKASHGNINRKERETLISITVHRALAKLDPIESYIAWRYWALEQSLREICEDLLRDKRIDWNHNKLFRVVNQIKPKLKKILMDMGGDKI